MTDIDVIKKSLDRLNDPQKILGYHLLDEYILVSDILKDTREDINKNGIMYEVINGKQKYQVINKSMQIYNKYIKIFIKMSNDLSRLIPNNMVSSDFDSDDLFDEL